MKLAASCLGLLLFCYCLQARALYSWEGESSQGDVSLSLRGFASAIQYTDPFTGSDEQDTAAGGIARIIAQHKQSPSLAYEFNAYQTYIDALLAAGQSELDSSFGVERSSALEWSQSDSLYAQLAIDRLNLRYTINNTNILIGRQAINLATNYFFSPNDFFAPFSAQSFYRVYKAGVDAIRADIATGQLSQLSFIAVAGYQQDPTNKTGWGEDADRKRHSYLVKYTKNSFDMEIALLVGKVRRDRITGGSIQGEIFKGLGFRLEGHRTESLDDAQQAFSEFSLGFDYRWQNSLYLQLEQFYHGKGGSDVTSYDYSLNQTYHARRYYALGLSYEITPLLMGQLSAIRNYVDQSTILTANLLYSLSDESELSVTCSLPDGRTTQGASVASEFGNYPTVINLEIRSYF